MARVARYASLFYAHLVLTCEDRGGELVLAHRVRGARAHGLRHANEYALASALHHARRLTQRPISRRRACGSRTSAGRRRGLRRFFGGAPIAFDRPDSGLAFAPEIVALPTHTEDARLLATAEAMAERALRESPTGRRFHRDRRAAPRARDGRRALDVQAATIARQMRLSPRTLQRRLAAEGTGFKELLETTRRDLARGWVRDGSLPLTEIAYRLGYSDAAAFSRAFKRWTGRSPGAFRDAT